MAHANVCEVVVGGRIGLAAVLHGLRHQLLGLLGGRIPLHPAERPGAAARFPQCSCDADCIVSVPVLTPTMSFRRGQPHVLLSAELAYCLKDTVMTRDLLWLS